MRKWILLITLAGLATDAYCQQLRTLIWWDDSAHTFTFCGEREIAPDLSSEIVSHVPHFYVVGMEIHRQGGRQ